MSDITHHHRNYQPENHVPLPRTQNIDSVDFPRNQPLAAKPGGKNTAKLNKNTGMYCIF